MIIKYRPCFTAILMKLEGIFNFGMNFWLLKLDLRRLPGNNIPPGCLKLTLLPWTPEIDYNKSGMQRTWENIISNIPILPKLGLLSVMVGFEGVRALPTPLAIPSVVLSMAADWVVWLATGTSLVAVKAALLFSSNTLLTMSAIFCRKCIKYYCLIKCK